jgi:hypothetical protein
VNTLYSVRFQRSIRLTFHARQRMSERNISDALLLDLLETGTIKYKDARRAWIFKSYPDREDNLICAAVALEQQMIIKTVMHHFQPE